MMGLSELKRDHGVVRQRSPQPPQHLLETGAEGMVAEADGDGRRGGVIRRDGPIMGREERSRPRQKQLPRFGRSHQAGRPVEKLAAERSLERLYALADGRLHRPGRFRCPGQVAEFDGENEQADRFQIEHHKNPRCNL